MENEEKVVSVHTTIPLSTWNLAREKHFPWNECLILGIKTMNGDILPPNYAKLQKQREKMQEEIFKKDENNEKLRHMLIKQMEKKLNERTNKK